MATKQKVFLIRAELGQSGRLMECVMRLPVDQYGGITHKAHEMIGQRFLDGNTGIKGRFKYALCLEAFSNAEDLKKAIENYQKNTI